MRTIIYPIFLSCREMTQDLFWKKIFENMAYGETPKGIHFKDNTIYSTFKKKEFNYNFATKEHTVIYEDIYYIFTTIFGIKSNGDLTKKKDIFDEFNRVNSASNSEDVWSKIKKKTIKNNLIQDFVISSKNKYNLSVTDTQRLYFYICVGNMFKIFTNDDIHLEHGSITKIDGVEFDEGVLQINRVFTEPASVKKYKHTTKSVLLCIWEEYSKNSSGEM
jgi:hypothetical protein